MSDFVEIPNLAKRILWLPLPKSAVHLRTLWIDLMFRVNLHYCIIELCTLANGHCQKCHLDEPFGCYNWCVCLCVCHSAFWGELEAEAAANTQRPLRSLIVCLHNKSNVSREIIYTRTVLNKWMPHLLNARAFFMLCFAICLRCSMIAWQHTCLFFQVWL